MQLAHLLAKIYLNRYQGKEYGTPEYGRRADGTIDNGNEKSYLGMLYKGEGAGIWILVFIMLIW
ncbi:hypothetical protein NXU95_00180 [Phocaeicola vulgatus]|nr:hypothetical protein [Phocaeicola vulgatus]